MYSTTKIQDNESSLKPDQVCIFFKILQVYHHCPRVSTNTKAVTKKNELQSLIRRVDYRLLVLKNIKIKYIRT